MRKECTRLEDTTFVFKIKLSIFDAPQSPLAGPTKTAKCGDCRVIRVSLEDLSRTEFKSRFLPITSHTSKVHPDVVITQVWNGYVCRNSMRREQLPWLITGD